MTFVEIFSDMSAWSLVLLILGVILLVVEMFTPGFGAFGGTGVALLIVDVIISAKSVTHGLILGGILILLLGVIFIVFLVLAGSGKLPKRMVLFSREDVASGYVAADFSKYLGAEGVASTPLRPAGVMKVDDDNLSVVSDGEFIEKGAKIKIKTVEGNRIVVEKM